MAYIFFNPNPDGIETDDCTVRAISLLLDRDGSGNFLLSGWVPQNVCGRVNNARYLVGFGANIAIPEGGTVGAISVAIAIDGSTEQETTMIVTPAAVEEYFNVGRQANIPIWRNCCETVSIRNTSDQPILMMNANILFDRPDLHNTR